MSRLVTVSVKRTGMLRIGFWCIWAWITQKDNLNFQNVSIVGDNDGHN